jgi:hypothetical protein
MALPSQELQKRAVPAIHRMTLETIAQMERYLRPLFRGKLLVQIFPEQQQYFFTFHCVPPSPKPFAGASREQG